MVVAFAQSGQQVKSRQSEGMNHAVGAAGQHHIGFPATNDLGGFADRLAACSAGRQAIEVWALGVEQCSQVSGWHVWFLFDFLGGIEQFQAAIDEFGGIEFTVCDGGCHHSAKDVKVLVAFATAQIDPKPGWVIDAISDATVGDRLSGRTDGELGVPAEIVNGAKGVILWLEIPVFDFGTDFGGESAGIE